MNYSEALKKKAQLQYEIKNLESDIAQNIALIIFALIPLVIALGLAVVSYFIER